MIPSAANSAARYSLVIYGKDDVVEINCIDVDDTLSHLDPQQINWITVRDVHDEDELRKLLDFFRLDPFLLREILDETMVQFETEYEDCLYLEYMVPYYDAINDRLMQSNGSFVLGHNFLIVYEHQIHGLFARARRRILSRQTKVQNYGPDYLLYLLLRAAIVEHYQQNFKRLIARLEELEDIVLTNPEREEFYDDILIMRQEIKPWNDPLLELEDFLEYVKDAESRFITDDVTGYFAKSLYREVEGLLSYHTRLRQMLKEIADLYMANVARKTGRVNQVLTVIATIFLPITFIASIYGMNFKYMPELDLPWAYPTVLVLMASVAIGILAYMKYKRWL